MLTPSLPYGLTMSLNEGSEVTILEASDRTLSGVLSLPYISPSSEVQFLDLEIPSSGLFTQRDLDELWVAGNELADWRARVALAADHSAWATPEIQGLAPILANWRALIACAHDAAQLLAAWPSTLDRRLTWVPVGVPAGYEDLHQTELGAGPRGTVIADDSGVQVTQSARWIGTSRNISSFAVPAIASVVLTLLTDTVRADELGELAPLMRPIAEVSSRANSTRYGADPDPSSWPLPFTAFVGSCMKVISELAVSQRGTGATPLLDTSELYEAWVALKVRAMLDQRFGPWQPGHLGAIAAWAHDDATIELWVKPRFASGRRAIGAEGFVAVVADQLVPDILLSITRGDHTELTIFDAKAWRSILPEDALSQSAKYLYGLRRDEALSRVPIVSGVDLVACSSAPSLRESGLARIAVVTATPTIGVDQLEQRVDDALARLLAAISERENLASSF